MDVTHDQRCCVAAAADALHVQSLRVHRASHLLVVFAYDSGDVRQLPVGRSGSTATPCAANGFRRRTVCGDSRAADTSVRLGQRS